MTKRFKNSPNFMLRELVQQHPMRILKSIYSKMIIVDFTQCRSTLYLRKQLSQLICVQVC